MDTAAKPKIKVYKEEIKESKILGDAYGIGGSIRRSRDIYGG
jgi:hypothetical protein